MDESKLGIPSILTVIGFIVFMLWASLHYSSGTIPISTGSHDPKRLIGQSAPEIDFDTPDGKSTSVKQIKKMVILINFWTSWCTGCMRDMPALKMLENHFAGKGFIILAFNIDEIKEKIKGKLEGGHFPKNLIFNFNKNNLEAYDVKSLPLSVLLDSEGTVKQVFKGPQNWMNYDKIRLIDELVKN